MQVKEKENIDDLLMDFGVSHFCLRLCSVSCQSLTCGRQTLPLR